MLESRWRGQPNRLEVWYTTLSDPVTGTGVWIHHELVAPSDGAPAYAHGWTAVFPPDASPHFARFGPAKWQPGDALFTCDGVTMTRANLTGSAGELSWELTSEGGGSPLYTFPRWAWRRELLPAAHMLPAPSARFTGSVTYGGRRLDLREAPGGTARIFGHGNAERWGWLHADLGGGDLLEIVAAVSTRPLLNRLPPLPLVRLRLGGREWPRGDSLLNSRHFRAELGLPSWTVRGRAGKTRLSVEVALPPQRTQAVDYTDPDGAAAVCHNSERASASILLERRTKGTWAEVNQWRLDGTAHAEIGLRTRPNDG